MARLASCLALSLLLFVVLTTPGCGNNRSNSQLLSINVAPATAAIQNYPGGLVPFAALGTFSAPPSPLRLTSPDIVWCVGSDHGQCAGNIATAGLVDQKGQAHCAGFAGTVNILAGKPLPIVNPDTGPQLKIFGSAQLTCH